MKNIFNLFKIKNYNTYDKFRANEDLLITYNDLKNIPLNKMEEVEQDRLGAIQCTRINSLHPDRLMFTVSMKKDEVWKPHHHNCLEKCIVKSGLLLDSVSGITAGPFEILEIKAGITHFVIAKEDCIFYVEFTKPPMK